MSNGRPMDNSYWDGIQKKCEIPVKFYRKRKVFEEEYFIVYVLHP
jgi:hypothetical protein